MEANLEHTTAQLREVSGQIQGMKDRVAEAQATMEKAVREHKDLNERLEREYDEKDRRLKDTLRKQMDRLIEEQI